MYYIIIIVFVVLVVTATVFCFTELRKENLYLSDVNHQQQKLIEDLLGSDCESILNNFSEVD